MQLNIKTIGSGKPRVAIVGCVHGDEIIGKKVIAELEKLNIKKGTLLFILANEPAMAKKTRWIKKDLNRSFPGKKNGVTEDKIAYYLNRELKKCDLVIDIHATNSNFNSLAIVTKLDKKTKELLKLVPVKKTALIRKKVFGGNEMVAQSRLGLALEYGPDKTGKNYKMALRHLKLILKNLGVIGGKKEQYGHKEIYNVSGTYPVANSFKQNKNLKDFMMVKKSDLIGWVGKKEIRADKSFYPLFLGKGRYKGLLSITASTKKIVKL